MNDAGMIEWKDEQGNRHVAWFKHHNNEWALQQGLNFVIMLGEVQEERYAKILKTVAYVAVDEDADGKAVLDKWEVKTRFFEEAK